MRLYELAKVLRSKNSGPYEITLDILLYTSSTIISDRMFLVFMVSIPPLCFCTNESRENAKTAPFR